MSTALDPSTRSTNGLVSSSNESETVVFSKLVERGKVLSGAISDGLDRCGGRAEVGFEVGIVVDLCNSVSLAICLFVFEGGRAYIFDIVRPESERVGCARAAFVIMLRDAKPDTLVK